MKTNRNLGIDGLRLICAVCIICFHTSYPYKYLIEPAFRFAVPIFFMISGYFHSVISFRGKMKKQIGKAYALFIGSNLLYFFFNIIVCLFSRNNLTTYFHSLLQPEKWLVFILFNESPFSQPLWFLHALLYTILLVRLCDRTWDRRKLYPLIPFLLLGNLLLGTYSLPIFGKSIPAYFSRNFLLFGLPFYLLGDMIKSHDVPLRPQQVSLLLVLSFPLVLIESYILYKTTGLINRNSYLFTPFCSVLLFLLVVQNRDWFHNRFFQSIVNAGKELSLWIYLLHPLLISILKPLLLSDGFPLKFLQKAYLLAAPIIITLISLPIAWMLNKIFHRKSQIA